MTITEQIWEKWAPVMSHGDARKIADLSEGKVGYVTVLRAFQSRQCSETVFRLMADYYNSKLELVNEALNGTE